MMLILILHRLKTIKQQMKHLKYQKQQKNVIIKQLHFHTSNYIKMLSCCYNARHQVLSCINYQKYKLTEYKKLYSTKWSELDRYPKKIIQNIWFSCQTLPTITKGRTI
ncbi:unnamed protein product [Paramecium pentaurelia]|uniref:Uncharacterized protein n=1 Tax=Paramecium pentaurelia TaxID=43138 RepID=A0A8S1VXB5_9CILI|nr:unnamed protein product [Paramecium pentaurelia]